MIATVQKNTSYEQSVTENFYQTHHQHQQHNDPKERPNVLRRISLHTFPSKSDLKSKHLVPSVNLKIISLCIVWYLTSVLSNNTTKTILKQFKYPITLTQFQFIITQFLCLLTILILKGNESFTHKFPQKTFPDHTSLAKFIKPTRHIIMATLPMGAFQFIGHITSHKATSIIPVSLVHTIKLLSPITTVLIYRFVFHKNFNFKTYLTLIPLVVGVMLSCLKPNTSIIIEGYGKGCFFAFLSMIIFVSQNMFAKPILSSPTPVLPQHEQQQPQRKLDKLTILYWCSTIGFVLTMPIYLLSEFSSDTLSLNHLTKEITYLLLINGLSHFTQSLMAFQILGLISTVNYSIVNILKRICVILLLIIYEGQKCSGLQSVGLVLTIFGFYSYDKWGKN